MQNAIQNIAWFLASIGLNESVRGSVVATVAAILFLLILRRMVLFFVNRRTVDIGIQYHWRKGTTYVAFVFSIFVVAAIWFRGFSSISTYLGILSAGLAIALQTPLTNLAGWLFILFRRPFAVGDRIQIGDLKGDVIDQKLFMFSLLEIGNWVHAEQSTGRVVHVPNGKVFSEAVSNYEQGFKYIWNEIPVVVTFESDWESAKEILIDIADKRETSVHKKAEKEVRATAGKMMIYLSKLTPIVYTSVLDHGVALTIRYLTLPRRRRGSEQEFWEEILHKFAESDNIDFAYPTHRIYQNQIEGKPGTKPADGVD